LHVLSTPPAFVLSQDQTLHQGHLTSRPPRGDPETSTHEKKNNPGKNG
jgi:hypothetical protein